MLNLSQGATLPGIGLHHRSTESILDIPYRAASIIPDNDDKRSDLCALLARSGCGQVWIRGGRIVEISATGRAMLEHECSHAAGRETIYGAVKQLINRAGAQIPDGSTSWLVTSSKKGITALIKQMANEWADGMSALILLDLDAHPEPSPRTLQCVFGLTAAETQLALELARGRNLLDIARARRLSRTTIRSQLGALFVKTQTRRQADLVALLGRVAILP
ncbi:helix-turn-helix transcriptional regulator [Bradyrhizobium sp. CB3481]|uniref:helix-turn-helix transcriptional regulator n=1 Tax=Bradyrhizobium sp. CB3481 TaxID=3039158 RepID=UPI0024B27617|nr:helix-turn-helix transcriptional regulator [Bradyrhizobium sp. CB3481]WFU18469.1 helix-turn-helix transcriptional regulator [Bradyrhizobium sp. CB3481]